MIRITYFRDKCIGCGVCAEIAPFRWRMSKKDGKSSLINGEKNKNIYQVIIDLDEQRDNKLAAENCPVKIIRLQRTGKK